VKKQLLLVFVFTTLVNAVEFSVESGCAVLQFLPVYLAWGLANTCASAFFADNHAHVVATVGALFSAGFLAGFLAIVAIAAGKRGLLVSQASLTKMLAIGRFIYLLIGALPMLAGSCI
jgi:hypothetical protein